MLAQWATDIATHTIHQPSPPPLSAAEATTAAAAAPSDAVCRGSLQGGPEQPFHKDFRLLLSGAATEGTAASSALDVLLQMVDVTTVHFCVIRRNIGAPEAEVAAEQSTDTADIAGIGEQPVLAMRLGENLVDQRDKACKEVPVAATLAQYEAALDALVETAVTALEGNALVQLIGGGIFDWEASCLEGSGRCAACLHHGGRGGGCLR